MYTAKNFKSKKALKEALAAGEVVRVFQPGGMFPARPGPITLEGPHYPEPHKWYASAVCTNDFVLVPGSLK